ncbi:hypothetical protein M8C21_030825, partial [Ambrosia artemisiifolia]
PEEIFVFSAHQFWCSERGGREKGINATTDDTLTGDLASVDVATKQNLDELVKVGEGLLDNKVSRVNFDTGDFEPVPNGCSNREALDRFAKELSDERKLRESNYRDCESA